MTDVSEAKVACPNMGSCAMYGLFKHAGTLSVFKIRYCNGAFESCARYRVASEGRVVPLRLMPNGQTLKAPEVP
ncbi:MAG: hypothetical protein R3B40_07060 [Polyangiales bacterium]|nr:hypothetical protein [Myxococcales bacterium]MCB9657691.1 hypothetical protein [Sandaracinaceae bacterium]